MKVTVEWKDGRPDSTYHGIGRLQILGAGAESWARPLPPVEPKPGDVLYLNPIEFRAIRTVDEPAEVMRLPLDPRLTTAR